MSEHVHDCPTPGCNAYTVCRNPCFEPQESECIDCLRAEVRRLKAALYPDSLGAIKELERQQAYHRRYNEVWEKALAEGATPMEAHEAAANAARTKPSV